MSALQQDVGQLFRQGFAWWLAELASLVPGALLRGFAARTPGTAISVENGGRLRLVPVQGVPISSDDAARDERAVWDRIGELKAQRRAASVALRVPYSACLKRGIEVPKSALNDVAQILALDLERATPLASKDVYTAHYVETGGAPGDVARVCQLVLKRSAIDPIKSSVEAAGASVDRIDCWDETGERPLAVNFLARRALSGEGPDSSRRRTGPLLAGMAAVLAVAAVWASDSRQAAALAELDVATREARERLGKLEALRNATGAALQEETGLRHVLSDHQLRVRILEELSRLLPDSAWLTEMRIDTDAADITGFAPSAAALVSFLESSPMFAEVTLAAPITVDDSEKKERFTYRMRLRNAPQTEGTASEPQETAP